MVNTDVFFRPPFGSLYVRVLYRTLQFGFLMRRVSTSTGPLSLHLCIFTDKNHCKVVFFGYWINGFESQHITTLFSNVLCRPRENYWHVAENQSFKRVAEIKFFPAAHVNRKQRNKGSYLTLPVGKCRIL